MKSPVFFCLFLACHSFASATEISPATGACQKALNAGDFGEAVRNAELALKSNPEETEAYLCLGRAQGAAGHHAASVAALKDADKHATRTFERIVAITQLGNQYKSVKAYDDAIAAYRQSIALSRTEKIKRYEMIADNLIGESLQESGDVTGALEAYQQGLKLAANDNERADSYAHLAAAYGAKGDYDQAVSYQLKTSVLEERSGDLDHYAHANLELAGIYLKAKQPNEAEKVLGKVLPVVVQAGDGYWEASIYALQGRARKAQGKGEEGAALIARGIELARKIGAEELARDLESTQAN